MPAPPDYHVELDVFEGPLDLLLHLVKKHELDVLDIPVAFVTEKYLEYLELMRRMNLDVAGEYLFMAATLAHLKSRELLPARETRDEDPTGDEEEELDPRQELIRRLLDYQKFKDAAARLGERPVVGRNVFTRGAPLEAAANLPDGPEDAPLAEVPVHKLLEALNDILSRARVKLTHDVLIERLSITDRINQLVLRLDAEGTFTFRSCFAFDPEAGAEDDEPVSAAQLKHQVVVSFLAILEMAKLKLIRLSQPAEDGDIYVTRAVPAGVPVAPAAVSPQGEPHE